MAQATTTTVAGKQTYICSLTGKTLEAARLPRGWKRLPDGRLLSKEAVAQHYVQRAVSLAIRFCDDEQKNGELNERLNSGFRASTAVHNWFSSELYARDVRRTPDMERLPPFRVPGLYSEAAKRFPLSMYPSSLLVTIEDQVRKKYMARRYEVLWTCSASLATYRYPAPYIVRRQDWRLIEQDGKLLVSVNIMRQRVVLELSESHRYERQREFLHRALREGYRLGMLTITRTRGGRVMARIAVMAPREHDEQRCGTLFVVSGQDCLLTALNAKERKLWTVHWDHVRRWVREYYARTQRVSDDRKLEDRRKKNKAFEARRDAESRKFAARMQTAAQQLAARVVGYASRRKFSKIAYNIDDKSWCPQFRWSQFTAQLEYMAAVAGVEVEQVEK